MIMALLSGVINNLSPVNSSSSLPPCVRANGSRLAGVCLLLGGSLSCDVAPFFFFSSAISLFLLLLLFLCHSCRFRSPLLCFWRVIQIAVYLVRRHTTVEVSRRAEKNQSPKPRYVCTACSLHSTFSVSPSSSSSPLSEHDTHLNTQLPAGSQNKTPSLVKKKDVIVEA